MAGETPADVGSSAGRRVQCYRCQHELTVSAKALSIFCPHCQQRLVLENVKVDRPHPIRELMTCGDLLVEAGGKLHMLRIVAENVFVRGRIIGPIFARNRIEIARTGSVEGDVEARNVVVHAGGSLRGRVRIIHGEEPTRRVEPEPPVAEFTASAAQPPNTSPPPILTRRPQVS